MNLEELTKHQIILLTLLVSFVTSIATGIVTVSLMDQAPQGVTKVVNQIVEHTVQTVIPSTQGAAAATTEKTVVVKDDDLTAQSIAAVQKSMVKLTLPGSDLLVARGVIVDAKGTVLTDEGAILASGVTTFDAILPSGVRVVATARTATATTSPLATLDLKVGTTTGWTAATLADPAKLSLGQSVIRIGGKGADTVGSGVIASLPTGDQPDLIAASVSSATPGSVLITIFGEVVGLTTSEATTAGDGYYTLVNIPPASTPAAATAETSSS